MESRKLSTEYENICGAIETALGPSKRYNRTAGNVKKQKELGKLDYKFKKFVKPDFKVLLQGFIEILEEPTIQSTPNYRRVLAYTENDFLRLYETFSYELGSWLTKDTNLTPENNRSFFNFPLFFKESCRKCNIAKYANMPLDQVEKILDGFIDLRHTESVVPRKDRDEIEEEVKVIMHPQSPERNKYNRAGQSESYRYLKEANMAAKVMDVLRDYGSGYGFDLLSYDVDKEILVAVKACDNMESFLISPTEYDTMVKACEQSNTTYFIHKYLYEKDCTWKYIMRTAYAYDPENNVLVDVEDSTNICNIERKEFRGKNGKLKVRYVCTPVNFKFIREERGLRKTLKSEE